VRRVNEVFGGLAVAPGESFFLDFFTLAGGKYNKPRRVSSPAGFQALAKVAIISRPKLGAFEAI
jgi:hypothetical protein